MIKLKKYGVLFLMLTILAAVLAGCGSEPANSKPSADTGQTYLIKLGHAQVASTPVHDGALKFAELVKEKTKGRVTVEVFPSAQIGSERDLIEGQKMGAVEMGLSVGSVHSQFQKSVEVVCLPFLFANKQEVYSVLDGAVGKELFSVMEKEGVKVLGHFENGFRQLGTNRVINSINDLPGLKLRTPEGDIYLRTWSLLGVNPTPIPWNEVFTALQTKVVDGEEAPLAIFNSSGFAEVTKYFAYINYCYDPMVMSISKSFWDKLPPELQQQVQAAADEAVVYQRKQVQLMEDATETELTAKQGMTFTRPDLAPFQAAVKPLYEGYQFQAELSKIQKALGR